MDKKRSHEVYGCTGFCHTCNVQVTGSKKYCDSCMHIRHNEFNKKYRADKKDQTKEYYRQWYLKNGRNDKNRDAIRREWKLNNQEKIKAHNVLKYHVYTGAIIKPEKCYECGEKTKIVGHHNDYLKPLDVIWLCGSCQKKLHHKITRERA